ncbi:hypothetical protein [Rhizobium ruizarguesonis]|uniref:hypothetical protein n=1 Tax=Rhizobium ruizarguesonis TaxID=2081791 RepID=UPI001FE16AC6|nr:hypothetical protein [Rhizobium ruizarguesonis]
MFTGSAVAKFVLWAIQAIGTVGMTIIIMLGYYEGVPGLRDIPFAGKIPVVREFIVGRVELERGKAADAAREGYVLLAEKTAAEAQVVEMERQRNAAAQASEEHRKRLEASQAAEQAAKDTLEQEISAHEKALDAAGNNCRLTDADVRWLRDH